MKKLFISSLLFSFFYTSAQVIKNPTTRTQLRTNANQLSGSVLQQQQCALISGDSVIYNGSWLLAGNAGTTPGTGIGTNAIGTTDYKDIWFKRANVFAGEIDSTNTSFGLRTFSPNGGGYFTGNYNTAVGVTADKQNYAGNYNTAVGYDALEAAKNGSGNTAIGYKSGLTNSDADPTGITSIGYQAGYNPNYYTIYNNSYNTYIGYNAGTANNSLIRQFYLGDSTSSYAPTDYKFGGGSLDFNYGSPSPTYNAGTSGQVLTSTGKGSSPQWMNGSGGPWSLDVNANAILTVNGIKSGIVDFTNINTCYGYRCGSSGADNVYIGYNVGISSTGNYNTIVGNGCSVNQSFSANTGMGYNTAQNIIGSGFSIWMGYYTANTLTSGTDNVILGSTADVATPTTSNAIALGFGVVAPSNTAVIGGAGTTDLETPGNIDIETVGAGLQIPTGTNATIGQATLSGGTVTVSTTAVKTQSLIFLTDAGGTITNIGIISVGTITNNTSFVINSSNILDGSSVNWWIINP